VPETTHPNLSGVPATSLAPIYWRAMEAQRPDALMKDEKAVALVMQMSRSFDQVRKIRVMEVHKVTRIMLTRQMDRYARDFLSRHPDAVVVHIGCGLDSRFERVDNGRVEWYDLDLPDIIALRQKWLNDEDMTSAAEVRHHLLACSALDDTWLEAVSAHRPRPCLFLAETVFVYFTEAQVKSLVLTLRDHFPGAELVFDGWTPFNVWLGNRFLSPSRFAGLLRWGIWRGQEIEGWGIANSSGAGIRLLDEWDASDQPEPRMAPFRWMVPIVRLFKIAHIFHFRLGETIE